MFKTLVKIVLYNAPVLLPNLRKQLLQFTFTLQNKLFPILEKTTGELTEKGKQLAAVLALLPLQRCIPVSRGWNGRPSKDRLLLAHAFIAKAVYNIPTTRDLIERLRVDLQLLQLCGWERPSQLPHEATFSRAFDEFATMQLPQMVHQALIQETQSTRLIGHICRDSTAVEARERLSEKPAPAPKPAKTKAAKKKPGPKPKSASTPAPAADLTRLQRQRGMTLEQMQADLPPAQCSIGVKTNSKGHQNYWRGYKLHLDVADGQIPISAMLSSASLHDSQMAIPMATLTAQRVTSLYDLMDKAYDAKQIREHSVKLGHQPIIDFVLRGQNSQSILPALKKLPRQLSPAEAQRYNERSMSERVNGRLKDEFGGRFLRVRGARKVMAHLMFGVLALTVDQILRLIN